MKLVEVSLAMDWAKWERAAGEVVLVGWGEGFSVEGVLVGWEEGFLVEVGLVLEEESICAVEVFDRRLERRKKKIWCRRRRGSLCYCSDTI